MGVITLTDRISVTVREKSSSGTSGGGGTAGGRDTASRLAKTLGGKEDLTDEELDSIAEAIDNAGGKSGTDSSGARTGRSIIDEQNREWLPIESVIAAGKRMQENGAFEEKEVHEGMPGIDPISADTGILSGDMPLYTWTIDPGSAYHTMYGDTGVLFFSKESFQVHRLNILKSDGTVTTNSYSNARGTTAYVNGVNYSYFMAETTIPSEGGGSNGDPPDKKAVAAFLFGPTHTTGGSLIDWTAPNAEIERQLKQHYDTFDPTDHDEGADGMWAGGYVLAGPLTALNEGN